MPNVKRKPLKTHSLNLMNLEERRLPSPPQINSSVRLSVCLSLCLSVDTETRYFSTSKI